MCDCCGHITVGLVFPLTTCCVESAAWREGGQYHSPPCLLYYCTTVHGTALSVVSCVQAFSSCLPTQSFPPLRGTAMSVVWCQQAFSSPLPTQSCPPLRGTALSECRVCKFSLPLYPLRPCSPLHGTGLSVVSCVQAFSSSLPTQTLFSTPWDSSECYVVCASFLFLSTHSDPVLLSMGQL